MGRLDRQRDQRVGCILQCLDHRQRDPDIIGEGTGWPNSQITPSGYAEVYHEVRAAIKAVRPNDEVLLAPPSPGGIIPGVRWVSGNDWLSQTISAVEALPGGAIDGFALHAYGSPFLSGQAAVNAFRNDYTAQLALIDGLGYQDTPVYVTEWARSTSTSGDVAANEAVTAEFIRGALADVHAWNQVPGNHNIVSLSWFVGNQDYGGWDEYSLERWQSLGNPVGHPGDLWTAFQTGSQYPAGLSGTRSPRGGPAIGDFNNNSVTDGFDFFTWQRAFSIDDGSALPADGDANDDGNVDDEDLAIWREHYGATAFGAESAIRVPESTYLSVQLAMLLLITARRR